MTDLQSWPPDVTISKGGPQIKSLSRSPVLTGRCHLYEGTGLGMGVPLQRWVCGQAFCGKVQTIIANGHMRTPREQTDTAENVTVPQLY